MKTFRRFVLLWMIAWLPLAGVRAAVMPIESIAAGSVTAERLDRAVQQMIAMPCHADEDSGKDMPAGACSHCELCHIAGALAIGIFPASPVVAPSRLYESIAVSPPPSFIPELLVPPPRLLAA